MILMADGSAKPAEDIQVGDRLIGDSGFRTVLELHRGRQEMVKVIPTKGNPFVVNLGHILSLVHTETGDIVDVSVQEWLGWAKHRKHCHKLYRVGVAEFEGGNDDLPIHPWLLGVLIGDGYLGGGSPSVTNPEKDIQARVIELATDVQGWVSVHKSNRCDCINLTNPRGIGNPLIEKLKRLGLYGSKAEGKFIPDQYKTASVEARYEMLAGLLDTDGHLAHGHYDWISKSEQLADDVCFVARSLGFSAYKSEAEKYCQTGAGGIYYRVSISGDFSIIPTVKHPAFQRLQKKSVLRTGFNVEMIGEDDYYGWEVDGNHRYLMGDFTVTHNSGKTRIAGEIIRLGTSRGKRVVFVANRIELVKQAAEAFEKLGIKCGILQGTNTHNAAAQVVVASIQTMIRRKSQDYDLIIIDECHSSAGSAAYHSLIHRNTNVPIIGLTATPWSKGMARKHKELNNEPLWQDVVVAATIPDLIRDGFLVDCDIYAPGEPDLTGVKVVNGDYDKTQLAAATDKDVLVGDIVKTWIKLGGGEQTVCFAVNVAHSRHIVEQFKAHGFDARHVDGYMDDEERKPIIEAFRRGEFQILSNCSMLSEGFDVPSTSVCVLARPTRSQIRFVQMVGRVLRPHPGKEKATILDHAGIVKRLGWPTEVRSYELDDGKPKEKQEKPENLPIVCPSCFAVRPRSVRKCPVCKFEPKPTPKEQETEDGELVQLSKKATNYTMQEKQRIYSALLGWCQSKGLKPGLAYYKFKDMVGHFPSNKMPKEPGPMTQEVEKWLIHERIKYQKSKEKENIMRRAA
jgi:superfamily II DNA or RNA helicase